MSADKGDGGRTLRETMTPGRIATLVLVLLALVFIFENTQEVRIRLIVQEVSTPLWMALLATFLIGVLAGRHLRRTADRRR
jgi:uncharacterized integral membrane protein